jgi:hypothetical protein
MKRIFLGAAAVAASLLLAPVGVAQAHYPTTSREATVKIQPTARFNLAGFFTDVGLVVTCPPNVGLPSKRLSAR